MLQNLYPYLAQKYGTPAYIYDFDKITQNVNALKCAFNARKSLLCYALKANANLSLLKHLAHLDCGADCVSINEVKRALLAGIPKYKIIYSGVGKSDDDLRKALQNDILFINVESTEELLRVEQIASDSKQVARISIRVNPNIDAKTHPYISTGLRENKFGVDIECAKKMFIYAKKSTHLQPIAAHFHIGSQLLDLEPITQSAEKIVALIRALLALKIDLKFIDVGGGLGIAYNDEKIIDLNDYAQGILGALKGVDLTIICELGRRIVGDCGVLLARILYEKQNEFKRFCIVDAAMNDLIRPALYGAKHRVCYIPIRHCEEVRSTDEAIHKSNAESIVDCHDSAFAESRNDDSLEIPELLRENAPLLEKADIVGPICESSDYLAKDIALPRTNRGDIIAILDCGAYGFSMASSYNSRLKCAEVAIENGDDFLIRARETFAESTENELKCLKSQNLKRTIDEKTK
ncbi:diaminopimelate decarboxylase [Helicobacter sp. 23-1044]